MARGIFGKKLGMTQVFSEGGRIVPVTVLEVPACRLIRVKTVERDGYGALVLAIGSARKRSKPVRGQVKGLSGVLPERIREIRDGEAVCEIGEELPVATFAPGAQVDATAISKGHGFSGTVKRWGSRRGPMTHGSKYHRGPGSMGARMSGGGGKVMKGKKLPGHYGHETVTIQNLEIVSSDEDRRLILVKGAVPGPVGALVRLVDAKKERIQS